MTQVNVMTDLSTIAKVPNKVITELTHKEILCICSAVSEAVAANEPHIVLNIGLGTLSINLPDMQCKFLPSNEFKTTLKKCLNGKIDPLEFELEKALTEKLLKAFNEVF